jgi:putative membrane protein
MMYGYGTSGFAGGWAPGIAMGLGVLMMVALWGVVILGIVFLFRALTGRPGREAHTGLDAVSILQRRYAAGEMDEQTYQRMRRELVTEGRYPRPVERAG